MRTPTHTLTIRHALRDRRLDLAMSQRELAQRLGIESTNYVSMIETGATAVPLRRAAAIAEFLGLEPWAVIRAILLENEGDGLDAHLPTAA